MRLLDALIRRKLPVGPDAPDADAPDAYYPFPATAPVVMFNHALTRLVLFSVHTDGEQVRNYAIFHPYPSNRKSLANPACQNYDGRDII